MRVICFVLHSTIPIFFFRGMACSHFHVSHMLCQCTQHKKWELDDNYISRCKQRSYALASDSMKNLPLYTTILRQQNKRNNSNLNKATLYRVLCIMWLWLGYHLNYMRSRCALHCFALSSHLLIRCHHLMRISLSNQGGKWAKVCRLETSIKATPVQICQACVHVSLGQWSDKCTNKFNFFYFYFYPLLLLAFFVICMLLMALALDFCFIFILLKLKANATFQLFFVFLLCSLFIEQLQSNRARKQFCGIFIALGCLR